MRRLRRADVITAAVALLLLVLIAALQLSEQNGTQQSVPSTYDTGRNGYAALYDVLAREHVDVSRYEQPLGLLTPQVRTLVMARDFRQVVEIAEDPHSEYVATAAWIRRGGRLVILDRDFSEADNESYGVPDVTGVAKAPLAHAVPFAALAQTAGVVSVAGAIRSVFGYDAKRSAIPLLAAGGGAVAIAYPFGKGEVIAITDPSIFSNYRLRDASNARFAYNVFASGPVAFDERIYGFVQDRTFWEALPEPVHVAVYIVVAVVLLGLLGANVRFAPALRLDRPDERDSSAYIESMARLLARGRAARHAIDECVEAVLRLLRQRFGLSPKARVTAIADRLPAPMRDALFELDRLRAIYHPSDQDLLRAGIVSARLRKDFE